MQQLWQRCISHLKRHSLTWLLVGMGLFVIGWGAYQVVYDVTRPRTTVRVGDGVFNARVVATGESRKKGLAGVEELPDTKAMLFVFETDALHGIWMKDMKISIDVIWLDKDKKVIHIVHDMRHDEPLVVYTPPTPARYVLEVAAGVAQKRNIRVGSVAAFDVPSEDGRP